MSDFALGTRLINRVLILQKSRSSVEHLRKISSTPPQRQGIKKPSENEE